MTVRTLPRDRLTTALPPITAAHSLIALVPMTGDAGWAAETAWSVARAAATGGRKVMLVDLSFEDPVLHRHVGDTLENGIVDAFEYDVSLNYVTRSHLNGTLFFIPRGSDVGDAVRVLESPRWTKLAKGLASQGALLLLYLTPSSLARLGARCDGVLVLAPAGYEPESTPIPPLDGVWKRGTPLLGVVSDLAPSETSAPSPQETTEVSTRRRPPQPTVRGTPEPRARRRGARWLAGAAGTAAVAWIALRVLGNGGETQAATAPDTGALVVSAPTPPDPDPSPPEPEPPRAPSAEPFASPRPFVVQVAAYDAAEAARARALRLTGSGRTVFVTPLALGNMGTWYRVYVGPFVSERGAVDARAGLWTARVLRRNEGIVRRAPFSLEVVADQREAVEQAGLVPYVVEDRVLIGAFEFPEQTAIAADALTSAGIPFTLIERAGSR